MSAPTPESVTALSVRLLQEARIAASGRAAPTPIGGSGHVLRQTVIALRVGEHLPVPPRPHSLTARSDATVLLTVAKLP